jgi:hypothetical protein
VRCTTRSTTLVKARYNRDMSTTRKSKHLTLTEQDYAIIAFLQEHFGITSQNEVIRMALRMALRVAKREGEETLPVPTKTTPEVI